MAAPKTIEEAVERGMREINEHMEKGVVPKDVREFTELHDYVDGNEYGGFTDDDYDLSNPIAIAQINETQMLLDLWLKSGRKVDYCQLKYKIKVAVVAIGMHQANVQLVTHPDGDTTIDISQYRLIFEPTDEGMQLDLYHVKQLPGHGYEIPPETEEHLITDFAEPFHYPTIAKCIGALIAKDLIEEALQADYMERLERSEEE